MDHKQVQETAFPPPYQPHAHPGFAPMNNQGYPQPGAAPISNQPQLPPGFIPIVTQPTLSPPAAIPNCPPGLEYLASIDQLLVHQKIELLEAFTGFETENKYVIKNSLGQQIYFAMEESDCCSRQCGGSIRAFDMKILDNFQNEVIHIVRPLACQSCCFPCCMQSLEVYGPPGNLLGTVEQDWSILIPLFSIKDAKGETVLKIKGPFCTCSCTGDVNFEVLGLDGETIVGKVSKQWSGLGREMFTDADNFGITFPMDLDVSMKAVMLGACFLIDFMFFEKTANNNNRY